MSKLKNLAVLMASVGLASCASMVDVHPGSNNVRVVDASQVSRCDEIGSTTANVLNRVGFIDRDPAKVDRDLEQLARNAAVNLKGDSVVPGERPHAGERKFTVYRCLR
jgi:hypothetical protein